MCMNFNHGKSASPTQAFTLAHAICTKEWLLGEILRGVTVIHNNPVHNCRWNRSKTMGSGGDGRKMLRSRIPRPLLQNNLRYATRNEFSVNQKRLRVVECTKKITISNSCNAAIMLQFKVKTRRFYSLIFMVLGCARENLFADIPHEFISCNTNPGCPPSGHSEGHPGRNISGKNSPFEFKKFKTSDDYWRRARRAHSAKL